MDEPHAFREVPGSAGQGLSSDEIAGTLFLSEATVKTHINHLLSKLELPDRALAIVFAYQQGVV